MGCAYSLIRWPFGESQSIEEMEGVAEELSNRLFDAQRNVAILEAEARAAVKQTGSMAQAEQRTILSDLLQYQVTVGQLQRLVNACGTTISNLKLKQSTKYSTGVMKDMINRFANYDGVADQVSKLEDMAQDHADESMALLDNISDFAGVANVSIEDLMQRTGIALPLPSLPHTEPSLPLQTRTTQAQPRQQRQEVMLI